MSRVLVLVEGQTEKKFVKEVMAPELAYKNVFITARISGKPGHKGGVRSYKRFLTEIIALLRQNNLVYCTMMFDYYGLPSSWPLKAGYSDLTFDQVAKSMETTIHTDVINRMGPDFDNKHFIPYIQMHEFEALLFSSPEILADTMQAPELSSQLHHIVEQFQAPEAIDDNPHTAPSKRLLALCGGYQKVLHGNIAAQRIGFANIRAQCAHFNEWVLKLETLNR